MSAARDRLLDVMLEEEIGGARPPDVTMRVVAAARTRDEDASPSLVRATRPSPWRWVAAAALVILGLALGLLIRGTGGEAPLIVVSDVALLASHADGPAIHGRRFRTGAVVHAGEEIATLTFPGQVEVVLQPGSFVRIGGTARHPSLTYGSGKVTVRGGAVPLAIVLPAGTMEIDSDANGLIDRVDDAGGNVRPDDRVLWVANEGTFDVSELTVAEGDPN